MKRSLAAAVLLFCLSGVSSQAQMVMPGGPAASNPSDVAIHGMFAFGDSTLFLSHLPMFHAPHDYQVIFEALLDERGMEAYAKAKRSNPDQMVTVLPEPFSLKAMIAHPTAIYADIYKGHFERGGVVVAKHVQVNVVKIVHAHHLGAPPENSEKEIYFGTVEQYQAHFITAAPDFDQIDRIDASGFATTIYREDEDLAD